MWRVGFVGLLVARVAAAECEIPSQPPISVEVHGTTATLKVNGRARVVEATSCDELKKSVAVVIAMVLAAPKPDEPVEPVEPVLDTSPPVVTPPPTETLSKSEPPAPSSVAASATAQVVVDRRANVDYAVLASFGTSTSLGGDVTIGARRHWDAFSVTSELTGELPGGIAMDSNVSVMRVSTALVPCKHVGSFAVCGVLRAGVDHGAGSNLMNARSATEFRADLGSRLTWEQPVTDHLAVQLRGELDVATTTTQFDVDHAAVWRSKRFTGLAGAGVVVRFP